MADNLRFFISISKSLNACTAHRCVMNYPRCNLTTLLQINTSIHSNGGQSSRMADAFVAAWRARDANTRIVKRDLAAEPVPHLTAVRFAAFVTPPEERDAAQIASRRIFRRADRRATSGGRHRLGSADVQLRRAEHAEGLLRSYRASRRDVQIHGQGAARLADRQEGLRVCRPRRPVPRHAARQPKCLCA